MLCRAHTPEPLVSQQSNKIIGPPTSHKLAIHDRSVRMSGQSQGRRWPGPRPDFSTLLTVGVLVVGWLVLAVVARSVTNGGRRAAVPPSPRCGHAAQHPPHPLPHLFLSG